MKTYTQYENYINTLTKETQNGHKPSFKEYLRKQGMINSDKETNDTDIGRNFREYIDRKENKDNEQK